MSLTITIEPMRCEHCGVTPGERDWDVTYNLSPMWHAAGLDLRGMDGRRAADCAPSLRAALETLRADPERFRALNPSNGWGSYEGLVERVAEMLAACEAHPTAAVRVR